jgi:succinate dehydrogenase/fumarate reductase cytochrome b subunit
MTTAIAEAAAPPNRARAIVVATIAAVLVYPLALIGEHWAAVAATGPAASALAWIGVAAFLALALGLPVLGFVLARSARGVFERRVAHIAFAAPSLYVAAGAYFGLLKLSKQELAAWAVLWLAVGAALVWRAPPVQVRAPGALPRVRPWLRIAHGSVAAALVLIFLGAHLANHLSALLGSDIQKAIMDTLRLWYRSAVIQPVLIAGVLFMMISGSVLARARTAAPPADVLTTLQTLTGAYLFAFLFSHLTAAFLTRSRGIDTNWLWATAAPQGLIVGYVRLAPHYTMGVAALLTHLGVGLRDVLRAHGVAQKSADGAAWAVAAGGAVLAAAIMAGMLGLRL